MSLQQFADKQLLKELLPPLEPYRLFRGSMPALSPEKLKVGLYIGEQRNAIRAATGGDATFLLSYNNKEGALLCLEELDAGECWKVIQVKGADSKVSYRVDMSFDSYRYLGALMKSIVDDSRTDVHRLVMPIFSHLEGIEQVPAHRMGRVQKKYSRFRIKAGMRLGPDQTEYVYPVREQEKMAS